MPSKKSSDYTNYKNELSYFLKGKIMKLIKFVFTIALLNFSTLNAQGNQFNIPLANSDNVFSLFSNPAGLGTSRDFQMLVAQGYDKNEFQDIYSVALSLGNIGFAYQGNNTGESDFNRYTLGAGWKIGRLMKMGFSYSWNSSGKMPDGLSLGYLVRPHKMISFGFNGNFLNEPNLRKPEYSSGVSLRPFGDRFTLSTDALFSKIGKSDYFDDIEWQLNLETEPLDGVLLSGTYSEDFLGFGLSFAFNHGAVGSVNLFDKDNNFSTGSAYLHTSSQYFRSVIIDPKPRFIHFKLSGPVIEQNRGWGIFSKKQLTVFQFGQILKGLNEDKSVKGIVLELDKINAGYAKIQELSGLITKFKQHGKEVFVYSTYLGTREYLLASVADKIFMNPAGQLNLTGIQFTAMFLKGTLDKLGIVAELEHIKEYKSASEMFTRDSMSQYQREVINSIADQFSEDIIMEISENRGIERETLKEIINNGPYVASNAKDLKLVDDIFYADQMKEFVETENETYRYQAFGSYKLLKPYKYEWEIIPPEKIAIIYATGSIVSGRNSNDFIFGETMGDKSIAGAIRKARKNKNVKVIILRIDSGGGFAVASEIIWREVAQTTKGENKKPIIVSMSDAAASGGYFIACAADEIYADPATITGSIGIYTGKVNLDGLYKKLGINFQHIKRGDNAGLYTSTRGFTDGERQQIIKNMEHGYDRFISSVAEGRNMTKDEVNEIGRGRVWTGTQGVEKGIVDGLGGLYDVIKIAEEKAGIKEGEDYSILFLPKYGFVWPNSNNNYLMESQLIERLPDEITHLINLGYRFHSAEDEPYLYLMPYELMIE